MAALQFFLLALHLAANAHPPLTDGEFPTREGTAAVIRDRYITATSTGRKAHVGVVGTAGARGRTSPADGYLRRLTECKVIVSCGPANWEGDSRLGESFYAGALVLSEPLLDPPPGFVDGQSVLVYQNYSHMLRLVEHYLERPAEAAAIAARGKSDVAYTYEQMIHRILATVGLLNTTTAAAAAKGAARPQRANVADYVGLLNTTTAAAAAKGAARPQRARVADYKLPVLVPAPANVGRRGETWGPLNQAVAHSPRVRLAGRGEVPVAVLVDTVMVEPGTRRFFKGRGGVRTVLDELWPTVQQARVNASIFGRDGRAAPLLIGLDFADRAASLHAFDPQRRFDFWFKRSRVLRGLNVASPTLSPVVNQSFALPYPVKPIAMSKIRAALARSAAWSSRPYDVCSFFVPRPGATNIS